MSASPTKIKVITINPAIDWRVDGDEYKDIVLTNYKYKEYTLVKVDGTLINSFFDKEAAIREAYRARNLSEMVGVPAEIEVIDYGTKRE